MGTVGDPPVGATLFFNFTSLDLLASPTVPINTSGVTVSVYKDDSTSQSTDGVTYTTGFDGVVGLNNVKVNTASNGTFYSAGGFFQAIITAGTANAVSLVGYVLRSWTLQADAAYALINTVNTAVAAVPGLTWEVALASHTNAGTAGKKLGDLSIGSAPSETTVANAVWESLHSAHLNAGTFGNYVDGQISLTALQTTLTATPGAVWEEALASHTNTGTTGKKLGDLTSGSAPSASDVANAVWTAVVAEVSNDADLRVSIGKMLRGLFERFYNKTTQTATLRTHYKDDGTNTFATMPISDDGVTQSQGPSS